MSDPIESARDAEFAAAVAHSEEQVRRLAGIGPTLAPGALRRQRILDRAEPVERSDLPVGQHPNGSFKITDELIGRFDNAQTLARVVHARAGLSGWDLVVASTRDALEAVTPALASAEVARVRAQTAAEVAEDVARAIESHHAADNVTAIQDARIARHHATQYAAPAESVVAALPDVVGTPDPEADCHRCGRSLAIPWTAPSPLWNAVMRGGSINGDELFDGIVCPTCFAQLAKERGIAELWRFDAARVNVSLETVTPSGRVWDPETWMWREAAPAAEGGGEPDLSNAPEMLLDSTERDEPIGADIDKSLLPASTDGPIPRTETEDQ